MRRRVLLVLAGVLVAQAVLAVLAFTPVPHEGGDNAGYIALAHSILDRGSYQEIWDPAAPPHTKYPPVFPLVLAGIMALGVKSWVGLKMVPLGSTLLAGLFSFLWAKGRGGLAMGAAVSLLVSVSGAVVYYSHWILSDPTFLALTLGALWALERWERGGEEEPERPRTTAPGREIAWLVVGLALVILAYFTRSAGLPLVVAAVAWLAWKRRWRVLGAFLPAFGLPALLWWLRGRSHGGGEYVSEFWLRNPYQPELGRVTVPDLLARVAENLWLYVTEIVPGGVVGAGLPLLPLLGGLLFLLALLGWFQSWRKGGGVGEIFFPLYGGLILLWPQVWSGDRFALPLFPFLFLYAGGGLLWLMKGVGVGARRSVVGVLILVLAAPALVSWNQDVRRARACARVSRGGDPYTCYPVNIQEYGVMARWAGRNLPEGASVVTRKPRIFFLLSGLTARSIPFTTDPDTFLDQARAGGVRYLILDRWDNVAPYYVLPAIQARPGGFCYITGLGPEGELGTELFGLPDRPEAMEEPGGEAATLADCPSSFLRSSPREPPPSRPGDVPLLVSNGRVR